MSEQKIVQVRLSEDTIQRIEKVQERIHSQTKTGAIRSSIAIADMITDAISHGANVIIEEKNGDKFKIAIPGMA